MVAGDVDLREPLTGSGAQNLDASLGDINNVFWTCTRDSQDPPSWPTDSDGSTCGMPSTPDDHQGVGFPLQKCNGMASPLRADVHFPSCYNPDVGLTNYKENMAFPSAGGDGKMNCPEGHIHVPRLLFEIYWDTQQFDDRWTPDGKTQPFVLSNGDVTGYSLHADFLSAWDEDLLQQIIDTCDVQHQSMDTCPGIESHVNTQECECDGPVSTFRTAAASSPLKELPGGAQLSGFKYGAAPAKPASSEEQYKEVPEVEQPAGNHEQAPEEEEEPVEEETEDASPETPAETPAAPAPEAPAPEAPADDSYDEAPVTKFPEPTAEPVCVTKTKTVVETVTVYDDAVETAAAKAKRHVLRHARRHH